jgi:hypothetical protein
MVVPEPEKVSRPTSRRAAEVQNELFDLIFRHVTAAGAGSVVDDAANDVVLCKPKSETPSSTSVAAIPPKVYRCKAIAKESRRVKSLGNRADARQRTFRLTNLGIWRG